jgi:uncharacterized membrane protein YozB (DUF420 family)
MSSLSVFFYLGFLLGVMFVMSALGLKEDDHMGLYPPIIFGFISGMMGNAIALWTAIFRKEPTNHKKLLVASFYSTLSFVVAHIIVFIVWLVLLPSFLVLP